MKELFVTTYSIMGNISYIYTGFSFISKEKIKDHYFLDVSNFNFNSVLSKFSNYDIIYISIGFVQTFDKLLTLIISLKNTRFICGGSFCYGIIEDLRLLKNIIPNLYIECNLAETYFDSKQISNDYNYFYEEEISNNNLFPDKGIYLSYGLNEGCYWNKCIFCSRPTFAPNNKNRVRSLYPIFEVIKRSRKILTRHLTYRIITEALTYTNLKILFENYSVLKDSNVYIVSYMRADKNLIDLTKQFDSKLEYLTPCIGVESLCQNVLDFYEKGTKIENILDFIKILVQKRASIVISLILNFPYLTHEQQNEYITSFKEILLLNKIFKSIWITRNLKLYIRNEKEFEFRLLKTYPGNTHKIKETKLLPNSNFLNFINTKYIFTTNIKTLKFYHNIDKIASKQIAIIRSG